MVDRVLTAAAAAGASAEVFHYRGRTNPVAFSDNRLKSVETGSREVFALRVVRDGKVGFATATGSAGETDLVERALATAACSERSGLELADPAEPVVVSPVCDRVAGMEPEELVSVGQTCINLIRERHNDAQVRADVVAGLHEYEVANTKGCYHSYRATSFEVKLLAAVVQEGNFLEFEASDQRVDREIDLERLTARINLELDRGRTNAAFTPGRYPVVLTPGTLHEVATRYVACLEGRAVSTGFSPWADRVGDSVLSPAVTLHDDPEQEGRPGAVPVDDEGVVCRRRTLIDRGVLSGLLLDLTSARTLELEPTGNGFRPAPLYTMPPGPRPLNLVMDAGSGDAVDLIAQSGTCVLVAMLIGAWAGNPYSGEVNGNIGLGYLVRDGEIVGRLKDAMLSLNAFSALGEQLQWVSGDRQWSVGDAFGQDWNALLPWVCVSDAAVSARS